MERRVYETYLKEGEHLDKSRANPDLFRGTLRGDDNKIGSQAEFRDITDLHVADYDDYDYPSESEIAYSAGDTETSVLTSDALGAVAVIAGVALVGLGVAAFAEYAIDRSSRRREQRRHQEWQFALLRQQQTYSRFYASAPPGWYDDGTYRYRWWDGTQWGMYQQPAAVTQHTAPSGWYPDRSGMLRWWDGEEWTDHYRNPPNQQQGEYTGQSTLPNQPTSSRSQVVEYAPTMAMTAVEWQQRARAMFLSRRFSDEQWNLLSNVRIRDAAPNVLAWQRQLGTMTAEQFTAGINQLLSTNPQLEENLFAPITNRR